LFLPHYPQSISIFLVNDLIASETSAIPYSISHEPSTTPTPAVQAQTKNPAAI
jgi:hypothetical protein